MKVKLFSIMLVGFCLLIFSETVDVAVLVKGGINIEFMEPSITNKDFTPLNDGSLQWVGSFPWFYANNNSGGACKIQGMIKQPLDPGWRLQGKLEPPKGVSGVFGSSASGGQLITFTTAPQDFVVGISAGKVGDLQLETLVLTATFLGFAQKTSQPFNITIQWTVVAE